MLFMSSFIIYYMLIGFVISSPIVTGSVILQDSSFILVGIVSNLIWLTYSYHYLFNKPNKKIFERFLYTLLFLESSIGIILICLKTDIIKNLF
jgi:hypothetical protein